MGILVRCSSCDEILDDYLDSYAYSVEGELICEGCYGDVAEGVAGDEVETIAIGDADEWDRTW